MGVFDRILGHLGLVRKSEIDKNLNFARNVGKRLDEHRELVESLGENSDVLDKCWWHVGHLATQDDYLMRIYKLVNGKWPDKLNEKCIGGYVRKRPAILGEVKLPEYQELDK